MKLQHISLFFIGALLLFSCTNRQKDAQKPIPPLSEINSNTSGPDFMDITLVMSNDQKTDSSHIYSAQGLHNGVQVGFIIEIKSNIPAGISGNDDISQSGFSQNAVSFRSSGKESDDFIKALAELYKIPFPDHFTNKPMSFTVFSLNDKIADLDKNGKYKLKVFMDDDDIYGEIFLNIDTDKRLIELNEKDIEYRPAIIRFLSR